jgi:hypothetical protein
MEKLSKKDRGISDALIRKLLAINAFHRKKVNDQINNINESIKKAK